MSDCICGHEPMAHCWLHDWSDERHCCMCPCPEYRPYVVHGYNPDTIGTLGAELTIDDLRRVLS